MNSHQQYVEFEGEQSVYTKVRFTSYMYDAHNCYDGNTHSNYDARGPENYALSSSESNETPYPHQPYQMTRSYYMGNRSQDRKSYVAHPYSFSNHTSSDVVHGWNHYKNHTQYPATRFPPSLGNPPSLNSGYCQTQTGYAECTRFPTSLSYPPPACVEVPGGEDTTKQRCSVDKTSVASQIM